MKILLSCLVALLLLAACAGDPAPSAVGDGQSSSESASSSETVEAPPYEIIKDEECSGGSVTARCINVYTDATSEEDFNAITRDIRGSDADRTLLVTYYPNAPQSETSGTGFYFPDEGSAQEVLTAMSPNADPGAFDDETAQAMGNDGFYAISIEDIVREMTEEMEETG